MATPRAVLLLALALLTAGCLGGGGAPDDTQPAAADQPSPGATGDGATGGDTGAGPADAGGDDGASGAPGLDAPPEWQLGEWWRVRLTDRFTGESHEALRVVAGTEDDEYLVGMPRDDFSDVLMVLHVPGFGEIKRHTLGFEIHDAMWTPLQFPLEDGATWETEWQTRPVTAVATVTSPTTAEVEFTGQSDHLVATYDADAGAITRLEVDGYGTYEVIDHGYDHTGIVTVPHGHDLIFFHGRLAGALALGTSPPQPAAPVETLDVDPTYDRVSFAIILLNLADAANTATGVYHEKATAPDGTTYEATLTPADGTNIKTTFHTHDQPDGEWSFEHLAGGPGAAFTEGIAYHVYDVELPQGRILPSEGEHAHGEHGAGL